MVIFGKYLLNFIQNVLSFLAILEVLKIKMDCSSPRNVEDSSGAVLRLVHINAVTHLVP